jgi:hypothetical protein
MANTDPAAPSAEDKDQKFRHRLASRMLVSSILGVFLLAGLAIGFSTAKDRGDTTQLVFTSVLPLLGTWVGTILAFYFARDNLAAATDSTIKLQNAVAPTTEPSLTSEMIPAAQINAYDMRAGDNAGAITLDTLQRAMATVNPPSRRLPIRDATGAVVYILHDSTLTDWAARAARAAAAAAAAAGAAGAAPAAPADDRLAGTLQDLLDDPTFAGLLRAIAWVPQNGTISQARAQMKAVPNCNDVFVTATGQRAEPVLGWLTNTALAGIG